MKNELIEFKNSKENVLRGILIPGKSEKGVILLHGFERTATTETKFKRLVDELVKYDITTFRFDYTGCGLSDGDFEYTTVKSMTSDLEKAIATFRKRQKISDLSVVAHSLACCVVGDYLSKNEDRFSKLLLLAPALNQRDLLRYWFTINYNIDSGKKTEITWKNYRKYLNEKAFQKDIKRIDKIAKSHYISNRYFLENSNKDYSQLFDRYKDGVMVVRGDRDDKVPLESLNTDFLNKIIVKNGDHDLERPDMIRQWLKKGVRFLNN